MKFIKMFGLAAVAAMFALALLGTSSASADMVCTANEEPCSSGNLVGGHEGEEAEIWATNMGNAKLKTSIGTVECNTSETKGTITNGGGAKGVAVEGEMTALSFGKGTGGECWVTILFKIGCTVTTTFESEPGVTYPATVHTSESMNGKGTLNVTSNTEGAEPGAHVVCSGAGVNCTYSTSSIELEVEDSRLTGAESLVIAKEEQLKRKGTECPETSLWTANYLGHVHRTIKRPEEEILELISKNFLTLA